MLKVDLSRPLVSLVVNRKGLLSRKENRVFGRDNDMMDTLTAMLIEQKENDKEVVLGEEDDDSGGLIGFLNWLIEHQEQIRALIQMIMTLFASETEGKNVL